MTTRIMSNSTRPMTMDELRRSTPSVFAETPHDSRSSRYGFVPTSAVVEALSGMGYGVFSAFQAGSRSDKAGYVRHLLRFRQMDKPAVLGCYPEIVMINSHDGSSAYQLSVGLLRLVCSNGLMVSEGCFSTVRVKHSAGVVRDVQDGVTRIAGYLPALGESVARLQAVTLTHGERLEFASAALAIRYGEQPAPVDPERITRVRRNDDSEFSLWNTLNTVQENLMLGGQVYRMPGNYRRMTVRPVRSISGVTDLNRGLWELAERTREAKLAS